MAALRSFHFIRLPCAIKGPKGEREVLMASPNAMIFWNFMIVGTLPRCSRTSSDGLSVDFRACKEFEAALRHEFVRFVFFTGVSTPKMTCRIGSKGLIATTAV